MFYIKFSIKKTKNNLQFYIVYFESSVSHANQAIQRFSVALNPVNTFLIIQHIIKNYFIIYIDKYYLICYIIVIRETNLIINQKTRKKL